jgi:hypothetical protein
VGGGCGIGLEYRRANALDGPSVLVIPQRSASVAGDPCDSPASAANVRRGTVSGPGPSSPPCTYQIWFQARLVARAPRSAQAVLAQGVVGLVAELDWFDIEAASLGVSLEVAPMRATRDYQALLSELDEERYARAVVGLWVLERVYLEAWRYAASYGGAGPTPRRWRTGQTPRSRRMWQRLRSWPRRRSRRRPTMQWKTSWARCWRMRLPSGTWQNRGTGEPRAETVGGQRRACGEGARTPVRPWCRGRVAAASGVQRLRCPGRVLPGGVRPGLCPRLAASPDSDTVPALAGLIAGVRDELSMHAAYAARWGVDLDNLPGRSDSGLHRVSAGDGGDRHRRAGVRCDDTVHAPVCTSRTVVGRRRGCR